MLVDTRKCKRVRMCCRCTLTRTFRPVNRNIKAKGRPLGYLVAFLCRCGYDTKAQHKDELELLSYEQAERQLGRDYFRTLPGSKQFTDMEASDSDGSEIEPEDIPPDR